MAVWQPPMPFPLPPLHPRLQRPKKARRLPSPPLPRSPTPAPILKRWKGEKDRGLEGRCGRAQCRGRLAEACRHNPAAAPAHLVFSSRTMKKAVDHLHAELSGMRTGRAAPGMLDALPVVAYGETTQLRHVATTTGRDAHTLVVTAYDEQARAGRGWRAEGGMLGCEKGLSNPHPPFSLGRARGGGGHSGLTPGPQPAATGVRYHRPRAQVRARLVGSGLRVAAGGACEGTGAHPTHPTLHPTLPSFLFFRPTKEMAAALAKLARQEAETARVSVRKARQAAMSAAKALPSKDDARAAERRVQKLADGAGEAIDAALAAKEEALKAV